MHISLIASGLLFNVALFAWFFVTLKKHGLIFSPRKGFAVLKPMMICLLLGVIPGVIFSNILFFAIQNPDLTAMLPIAIGSTISAWLIFKDIKKLPDNTN